MMEKNSKTMTKVTIFYLFFKNGNIIELNIKIFAGESGLEKEDEEDKHGPSYIELRAEAAIHAKLRAETFMKAAQARGQKQWEVAQYYTQQVNYGSYGLSCV